MLNFLPCTPGKKFPSVPSWSATTVYTGEVGNERLLVAGCTSDGIECLDFDNNGSAFPFYWMAVPDEIQKKVYVEQTPSGGYHIIYRTPYPKKNTKLAIDENGTLLIETRGQGGLIKVAPSPGYTPKYGTVLDDSLPMLQQKQVDKLWELALGFHCAKEEPVKIVREIEKPVQMDGDSPADYLRGEGKHLVREALLRAGWKEVKEDNEFVFFSHPNASNPKDIHLSYHKDNGSLHNWSTNKCAPFDGDEDYSPLSALALLEYNGDTSSCGLDIRRKYMECKGGKAVEEFDDDDIDVVERPTFDVRIDELPPVLRDFVNATMKSARVKQNTLAVFAGLSAASYIIARRLRKSYDGEDYVYSRPLYVMAVSESGSGKDAPLKAAKKFAQIGSFEPNSVQPFPESTQAMGESVIEFRKMFYACDEAGDAIFFDKSNTKVQLKRLMKELFSESDYRAPSGVAANARLKEKLGTEHPVAFDQTTVFYATGCPDIIADQMSEQDFSEGLAGRFVYCLGDTKAKTIFSLRAVSQVKFPSSVYDWCKMWKKVANPSWGLSFDEQMNIDDINSVDTSDVYGGFTEEEKFQEPVHVDLNRTTLIVIDDETEDAHNNLANDYYKQGRKCRDDAKGLYLRAGLAVESIALVLACLETRRIDVVHLKKSHIDLAKRFVDYSIACVEYLLSTKRTTEHATAITKETNDNYQKFIKCLSKHKKETVSKSTIDYWFRGNDERIYTGHLKKFIENGCLTLKVGGKGTSYIINRKILEKIS